MSEIIKLTYEAADARSRYAKIHEAVFKVSVKGVVAALKRRRWIDYAANERELAKIARDLEGIEKRLSRLDEAEMSKVRGGGQIRLALIEYIQALASSVRMLGASAARRPLAGSGTGRAGSTSPRPPTTTRFNITASWGTASTGCCRPSEPKGLFFVAVI